MEDRPEVSALAVAAAASGIDDMGIDDMEIADQDLLLAIASPPTTGRTNYVKHLLTGQGIWKNDFKHCYAPEGGRMKAFSVELMVRDGTIVTGFNAASYCCFAPAVHQMKIEEVKVDGTIGKVLFPWNGCGTWTNEMMKDETGGLKRRNCAPEHIPVSTTATRFKVSIRHNDKVGRNSYGGVAIFDAVGIPAPLPPRHGVAPAPTSPSATLRRPDADMVDLRCDAVDGATAYLWTKVGGDPAWSKCAKEPSCSAYLEEVGSFGLTVRPLFPMRTTLADGGEVEWYKNLKDGPKPWELDTVSTPGAKNASLGATVEGEFSVPTEVINVLQTAVVLDLTTTDPALEKLLAGESSFRSRGSKQFDVSVPEGSIVMSFEIATLATTKTCQVDVAEINADGTVGARLVPYGYYGYGRDSKLWDGSRSDAGTPSSYRPESFPVTTTATRFRLSVHDRSGYNDSGGLGIFRAIGSMTVAATDLGSSAGLL